MSFAVTNYDSPIGPIEIHATDTAVSKVEFAGEQAEANEEESGERSLPHSSPSRPPSAHPLLDEVHRQLDAYFTGDLRCFDLPLELDGTPFQRQVWQQLLSVDYGQTASYQAIAHAIDNPKAVRAVGAANGRNPVSIIVPCHRIIGSGKRPKLTGYGGGLWRKEWLLRHEGVLLV